jgi:hypothetical protein
MKKYILAAAILCTACDTVRDEPAPAGSDTVRADTTAPGSTPLTADSATGNAPRASAPTQFDPQQIRPGTSIGGLQVAAVNVQPAQGGATGAAGSVRFSGQAEVVGSYRAHFDYPEVKQPCFWVDVESWGKLPRARGDQRIVWFCFENAEQAIAQLGQLGSQSRATIVIDNYTTQLSQSDAWDTARLVRVVRKEAF